MGVRRLFLLDTITQIFTLLVTASCALIYRSVWALVIGSILSMICRLLLSFYRPLIPGMRNSFCWDRTSIHELVHFGKWILLSTAFFFFASQADRLILGKLISFSLLGVYGIAYSVSDIPRAVINAFAQKVGYPFIAKMAHLPVAEFRLIFLRYRFRALLAGAAMLCLMVHLGGFLVDGSGAGAWPVAHTDVCNHTAGSVFSRKVAVLGHRQRILLRYGSFSHPRGLSFLRDVRRGRGRGRQRFSVLSRYRHRSQPGMHLDVEAGPAGNSSVSGFCGSGARFT
jgi:hypothetical protein